MVVEREEKDDAKPPDGEGVGPGNQPADKSAAQSASATGDATPETSGGAFHIVGIGTSAGGLEALKELFGAMPADSGMAFVIIQHLDPRSESRMAEILGKCTPMKIVPAGDGMPVEPNAVYTNPPGRPLGIRDGAGLSWASRLRGAC